MKFLKTLFGRKKEKELFTYKPKKYRGVLIFGSAGGGRQIDLRNGLLQKLLCIVDEFDFSYSNGKYGLFWKCKNLNSSTENDLEKFLEDNDITIDFHQYVGNEYSISDTINSK